jgi:hypothetical protein
VSDVVSDEAAAAWFAVRCVFQSGRPAGASDATYEERITLWRADSAAVAIERAEAEALDYAGSVPDAPDSYLGIAQSYRLFDDPVDGAEIFSLMRDSDLPAEDYIDAFFDTGSERQQTM